MNPLARLLAAVAGALALVGAFFFGFFILLAALALGLVAWIAIRLRIWWLRRQMGVDGRVPPGFDPVRPPGADRGAADGDVIDAEYEVVSRRDDD